MDHVSYRVPQPIHWPMHRSIYRSLLDRPLTDMSIDCWPRMWMWNANVTLWRGFLHSVLSWTNLQVLKIHKTKAVKKISIQEKISANFYIPGLALTGFQITRPCLQQINLAGYHKKPSNWSAGHLEKRVNSMSSKLEPTIWSCDSGQQIPCFSRCQLTITWESNIKTDTTNLGCMSGNLFATVWASVVTAAILCTCRQAILLAMITMRKSTHGFPFLSHMCMGLH